MKIADYLDKDEVRYFTARSNWQALWVVVVTWSSLLAVLWIVDTWTNPLTILLAIMLLAGRQLGLAVITHDCGHNTLFESKGLNHFVGQWFAAHPTFADMPKYASGHTNHHKLAGTREDPDLPNYQAYPVDRASFKRKMIRDMTGQTGIKLLRYVFSQARGAFSPDPELRLRARPFVRQIAVNSVLATVLALLFSPWVYILWLVSFLTTYMVIVRIRQVAEHAAVPDLYHPDPRLNTRTTVPSWWERMFFAPNFVNYHLEHHFMASVPCYKLKALHQLLKDRGAYGDTRIFHGYREVLQHTVA
jgi:fatty acid desaturase